MSAAPTTRAAHRRRAATPLALAGAAAGAFALLRLRDPHVAGSYGTCPFLLLTGLPCPACGGLRAANDLSHGDLAAALSANAYLVLSLAALAVWTSVRLVAALAGHPRPPLRDATVTRTAFAWLVGLLVFGALRWLPALQGLQP